MITTDQSAAPAAAPARNVIEALSRVMGDLPGIGRDQASGQGYNYRGIEAITAHVQGLFAVHGVVTVPRVVERKVKDFNLNSKPWTEDELWVVYRFYGPGGAEDFVDVGPIVGLGRDNSDKGCNKAMTQAYKYALVQVLCIGDRKDDPDAEKAHEADAAPESPDQAVRRELRERINSLDGDRKAELGGWCDEREIPRRTTDMTDEQVAAVTARINGEAPPPDPTAPQSPTSGPSERQDGPPPPDAPPQVPESVPGPESAAPEDPDASGRKRGEAASEPTADDIGSPDPADVENVITDVTAMKAHDVDKELTRLGMHTEGELADRRKRLAIGLLREKVQQQEGGA